MNENMDVIFLRRIVKTRNDS